MREMKDSGVPWIGEIPADWEVGRIKYNYYLKGRIGWQGLKATEFIDEGPYLVTGTDFRNGKVDWSTCYHISQERYDEAPEIHVRLGDLLITKDGTVGKVAYIDEKPEKVSLNSHLLIMRPTNSSYENRYLFWVIQSPVFDKYFGLSQNGTIMASLSQEKINDFSFAKPKLEIQEKISHFLDEKCFAIDTLRSNIEKQIEKLEEYKKSVIFEAVTKGLDPTVPMKDSGVPWIGAVPEHWLTTRLKFAIECLDGKRVPIDAGQREAGPYPYWGAGSIVDYVNSYLFDEEIVLLGEDGAPFFDDSRPVAFFVNEKVWVNNHIHVLKAKPNISPKFLVHFLNIVNYRDYINGSILAKLTQGNMKEIALLIPHISEQTAIASYLDSRCTAIDSIIADKKKQLSTLDEYKKSLIYEYVTGKKEVPA